MHVLYLAAFLMLSVIKNARSLPSPTLFVDAAESALPQTGLDVYVTVLFSSIPTWPESGEAVDVVMLRLGEWRTPDQIKSLPLHPLKARVMGAQYPAGSNGLRTPYRDLENIICEASVVGEKRVMVPHEQAPLITMPILFSFEDEEVVFQDRNESRTLSNLSLIRFGCW
ncbi:hypothetical protein MMC10_003094 [Thelotrema lepadinum]|nr:hypothetical protein [Thelotrema lepadinum]